MILLDAVSVSIPNYIGILLFSVLILIFFGGGIWVLATLEKRVEKFIHKNAARKNFTIVAMQKAYSWDPENPFDKVDIWIGTSSRIFGFSGERTFLRIVQVQKGATQKEYWAKVKTTFFMPSSIQWKEKKQVHFNRASN